MTSASEAVPAHATNEMAFSGNDVVPFEKFHRASNLGDRSDKLVSDDQGRGNRFLRPSVPVIDVEVGSANAGAVNFDEDIAVADGWKRDVS